ncbi:MAG TPA: efflux RND transporter periplasmic adaptor subunit [Ohtaekwangia sp.]|nr:efflux RND transporter periplasmic adaptor subunit [Ohtaekwangia sp.]
MNSTIYTRLTMVVLAGLFAACSATSPEDDKQARLEKMKQDQAALTKEIQALEKEVAKENPEAATTLRSKEVAIKEIAPQKFDHYVKTQGRIESENNILVSAKSPGVVTQVMVSEGQQVSKGQVLAQVDNSVILRSIESMKTQLQLANTVYERQKNLWDQKIGTEVQFLQARTNKENLEKQLASLQEQNDMTRIKAPITGTVDEVHVKVGENIAPGMPAVRVINSNDLKLVANISEAYVTTIKKNDKAIVSIPEMKKDIESKVTFVGRNIDPLSRTFTVEVKLNSMPDLRPNMTATLKVVFQTVNEAIVVPVNVIQTLNNEKIVYVAETKGKQTVARKRVVKVEGVYDNQAQVTGLSAGDKVITFGYQGLNDGDLINI